MNAVAERPPYTPPEGFMTQAQAVERLGISRLTFRKLVDVGRIKEYEDDLDTRVRLFRVEDVDALKRTPRPKARD